LYLVAGVGASTISATSPRHLPSARTRRYPSDLTDAEWQILAPLVPIGKPGPRGGRPPRHPRRDIVDAIRYVTHNGGVWRALPTDFPPWKTVHDYHTRWAADGTVNRIHNALRQQVRAAQGRPPDPSAALVDSQSVRAAETVGRTSRGYDAGKKVNGRKRHIATDTTGLLLIVLVTAAGVQDRDAGRLLFWALHACFPRVSKVWADGGYAGHLVDWAATTYRLNVEIVRKLAGQIGFTVLPRRWVVERTLCAARRPVVSPVQPGGTWREVPGSNGLPDAERLRGQEHAS
jgi:putative transposase